MSKSFLLLSRAAGSRAHASRTEGGPPAADLHISTRAGKCVRRLGYGMAFFLLWYVAFRRQDSVVGRDDQVRESLLTLTAAKECRTSKSPSAFSGFSCQVQTAFLFLSFCPQASHPSKNSRSMNMEAEDVCSSGGQGGGAGGGQQGAMLENSSLSLLLARSLEKSPRRGGSQTTVRESSVQSVVCRRN